MSTPRNEQIEVENVNHPGSIRRVDARMYQAMKQAYLKTLAAAPGALSLAQIGLDVQRHLPQTLFPGGAKSGWWASWCNSTSKPRASWRAARIRQCASTWFGPEKS